MKERSATHEPRPVDTSGNGERLRTLVYDAADAPMLMSAMRTGAARALMDNAPNAIARFRHYQQEVAAETHPAAGLMRRSTDLCEIAVIGTAVDEWRIRRLLVHSWSNTFRAEIILGRRTFSTESGLDDDAFRQVVEMVQAVLPLTCERVECEDVVGSAW